jgi:hypothetical protein
MVVWVGSKPDEGQDPQRSVVPRGSNQFVDARLEVPLNLTGLFSPITRYYGAPNVFGAFKQVAVYPSATAQYYAKRLSSGVRRAVVLL